MNLDSVVKGLQKQFFGDVGIIHIFLSAILSNNHILIEDIPGIGKTTLARAFAQLFQMELKRVQGTPDLLPADILGNMIVNPKSGQFELRRGPIFTQILFFDELNRTNPRTQSALLEAMAEKSVSIDLDTHKLPEFFFVVATQNPIQFEGTFPLPESQLDRFALCMNINYPLIEVEKKIILKEISPKPDDSEQSKFTLSDLKEIQNQVEKVHIEAKIITYIVNIIRSTRTFPGIRFGASPRAGIALASCSRAYALLQGRDFVTPDDVQKLTPPVLIHRIITDNPEDAIQKVLDSVALEF
ncbi:AAA family ATPase [Candidatus Riflebacteria bacterium]